MDLNSKGVALLCCEPVKSDNFRDTTLQLNFLSCGGNVTTRLENTSCDPGFKHSDPSDDGCELVLGLGPTPSAYLDTYCNSNQEKGLTMVSPQSLASDCDSILKLGLSGVTKEALSTLDSSISADSNGHVPMSGQVPIEDRRTLIPVVDEGSTSAKKSGGYMPSLLLAPRLDAFKLQTRELLELGTNSHSQQPQHSCELSESTDISMGTVSEQTTMTGASSEHRISNSKRCKFVGCSKGARGASGLCIGHGGGQRCLKPGCNKGSESRTAYCKAHGGGRRCQHLGCTKSAEGKTEYCIAHGGGRRCGYPGGCTKAARGKSGLCIRHGGGKRCKIEGCTRSAEGQAGLCISHGGGRRCQYPECTKGAQGSTMFCKAHGGGKRCIFAGCTKGAEGSTPLCKGHGGGKRCLFDGGGICPKSVHGGTNFCVAHGGGKRCAVPGCTKSARGRTDCCVRHGGGKRCKFANCEKSAQGSTDFCKAHGGGKRCTWAESRCEKFARGKSGLCAAHSSMAQERESNREGLIGPGLFHGLVTASSITMSSNNHSSLVKGMAASNGADPLDRPAKRQNLIPPLVLVPLSMKTSSTSSVFLNPGEDGHSQHRVENFGDRKSLDSLVPEGRVHGGGLMSLLGGTLENAVDKI